MSISSTTRRGVCGFVAGLAAVFAMVTQAEGQVPLTGHQPPPYAGCVNHAHAAMPFQWGAFGAQRYHPRTHWSRDYNGELTRWTYLRR